MAHKSITLTTKLKQNLQPNLKFPFYPSTKHLNFTNYISSSQTKSNSNSSITFTSSSTNNFTWNDISHIGQSHFDPSHLNGYFDKVNSCNRNLEKRCEFVPFVVDDHHILGYVHNGFAAHLRRFKDVFLFPQSIQHDSNFGFHITLHPTLKSPEDRTSAVGDVINCLGEELIPGIRNELYPVMSSFGSQVFFSLERAAAPYFGIKAYGVHMNGYVEKEGQNFLWIGKRSQEKSTYPGMLDHLVAGGLPYGIPCGENMMKECEEEARIPISIAKNVQPVGAVSYMDIDGHRFKRDVLFCYDLKLPEDFVPNNQDGEVESFRLMPVTHVANVVKKTHYFKSNCTLVIIDYLFRHGIICPEYVGYLNLLQALKCKDLS